MALIYIRKQGLDGANGRSMTKKDVRICLSAIAEANSASALDGTPPKHFSHVLFFGDFETDTQAQNLKHLVLETRCFKDFRDDQILYIYQAMDAH